MRRFWLWMIPLAAGLASGGCVSVGHTPGPPDFGEFSRQKDLGETRRIRAEIEFGSGRFDLEALPSGAAQAYRAEVRYDRNLYAPELETRGDSDLDLRFDLRRLNRAFGGRDRSTGRFQFAPAASLSLDLKAGITENQIDLTGLRVRELRLASGVGESRLIVRSPNPEECRSLVLQSGVGEFRAEGLGNLNCDAITFQGGVGEARLDFGGSWSHDASVDMRVGVGEINVDLPPEVGAEVRATRTFLSRLSVADFQEDGPDVYRSRNFDQASRHLEFDVSSGVGSVKFRWKR